MIKTTERAKRAIAAAFVFLGALAAPVAAADKFPSRPITVIVPFAPGGDTDIRARILQPFLQKRLGVPVVIMNRGGAGGLIGYEMIARAAPNGYTTGAINFPSAYAPILDGTAKYRADEFEPLIMQSSTTIVVGTAADGPYKTLRDLVAAAKKDPGAVPFAIPGVGTPAHLAHVQFERVAGAQFNVVPFGGGAKVVEAMLSQTVAAGVFNNTEAAPLVAGGRMRVLAVFADSPDPLLPNAPTAATAGYLVSYGSSGGFAAPKGIPPEILAVLTQAFQSAAQDAEYIKAADQKIPLQYMGRDAYARFLDTQYQVLSELWKRSPWQQK
jgi:tripartite-type tricarboxylate transporter receptor subunit TctC